MGGETEAEVSGWTVDTARLELHHRIDNLEAKLDERYATQTKAVDAAFIAQQTAMQVALTAAEKAVEAALASAEKAVGKAEMANEKRFEAANEWRGQSADRETSQQAALSMLTTTLLPREVADAQMKELRSLAQTALDKAVAAEIVTHTRKEGKQELSTAALIVIGCLGVLVALLSIAVIIILSVT